MSDLLAHQLHQLAFAVITGQVALTPERREALADLNAAAAHRDRELRELEPTPTPGARA